MGNAPGSRFRSDSHLPPPSPWPIGRSARTAPTASPAREEILARQELVIVSPHTPTHRRPPRSLQSGITNGIAAQCCTDNVEEDIEAAGRSKPGLAVRLFLKGTTRLSASSPVDPAQDLGSIIEQQQW